MGLASLIQNENLFLQKMIQFETELAFIRKAFEKVDLPGMESMLQMAPLIRRNAYPEQKNKTLASVMLLLYPKDERLHFPLIIRTSNNPLDKHSGQISFPGGKLEQNDKDDWHCALRECEEELGVDQKKMSYVGALTPNYIPISNFKVAPFVAYMEHKPIFNKQDEEVEEIIEIPFELLFDPEIIKCGEVALSSGIKLQDIPYFKIFSHKVWGATAMILNEFITLIQSNTKLL